MNSQTSGAYTISLLIHGGAALAMFLGLHVLSDRKLLDQAKVFELVAGEGDNYMALEAPALGTPSGVKIDIPPAPIVAPAPEPEPVQDVVTAAPMEAVKPEPVKPKPVKKEPSFTETLKKVSDRKEKQVVKKHQAEQARLAKLEAARLAKEKELASKRMTKAEFDKLNKSNAAAKKPVTSTAKGPRIDAEGIAKGVAGGSTNNKTGGAGGKALTREEQDQLDSYFAYLKLKVKAAHDTEKPDNVADTMRAKVSFMCAANGAIGSVRIEQSSGNNDFDQSVIRAVRAVGSVGARPDGKSDRVILEINMKEE